MILKIWTKIKYLELRLKDLRRKKDENVNNIEMPAKEVEQCMASLDNLELHITIKTEDLLAL